MTLRYALATALDQHSRDYEIVVSDNASEDGTRAVVEGFADDRIVYVHTGRRLSMCDNYEFALNHARGEYVIIIGDDDAVMPGGLDFLLSRLRQTREPMIYMWPLHTYDWPGEGQAARIAHLAPQGEETTLDLKAMARNVMQLGGWRYYRLPSPYHCAVPRSILTAIAARTGRVFHSTQPDVFTAMALPVYADRAVKLERTVTLHGRSPASNGRDFTKRKARANIDKFIREYGDYKFHSSLFPGVAASANMIPDAILRAKDMFPELYGDIPFDYSAMWAYVCRHRFASATQVLLNAKAIKQAHPMTVTRFLRYAAVHQIAGIRRHVLDALAALRTPGPAPETIGDFVRLLDREAGRSIGNKTQ
ncbi:glycosyltransferase [Sphingomonas sp. 7/4-4]|uniref:glycosyltransferase family 2 protein n=1 Tax=Sphingomonas sp. 7/4-4 TaxID=3018446 RepID=UPI0022F3A892|nr:glycosyltransferase [Sphingomonas sp. 7/4-4]WBY07964.1 glycosyltransferase [Sphingomonas sp. 7/4-4]